VSGALDTQPPDLDAWALEVSHLAAERDLGELADWAVAVTEEAPS
jgi:hypothetical protein